MSAITDILPEFAVQLCLEYWKLLCLSGVFWCLIIRSLGLSAATLHLSSDSSIFFLFITVLFLRALGVEGKGKKLVISPLPSFTVYVGLNQANLDR